MDCDVQFPDSNLFKHLRQFHGLGPGGKTREKEQKPSFSKIHMYMTKNNLRELFLRVLKDKFAYTRAFFHGIAVEAIPIFRPCVTVNRNRSLCVMHCMFVLNNSLTKIIAIIALLNFRLGPWTFFAIFWRLTIGWFPIGFWSAQGTISSKRRQHHDLGNLTMQLNGFVIQLPFW